MSSDDSEEEEYEVERILDVKGAGKTTRYLIKWKGYDDATDNTWEPADHLSKKLIAEFQAERKLAHDGDADDSAPAEKRSSKSPAGGSKGKAPEAAGSKKRATPTTTGGKRPAAAVDWTEAPPSAELICSAVSTMDATSLKAFVASLSKEGFPVKAAPKKEQVAEDLSVVVRATYDGLCLVQASSYSNHRLVEGKFVSTPEYRFEWRHGVEPGPAKYGTERIRSCLWTELGWPHLETFNRLSQQAKVAKLEAAWSRAAAGDASKKQRASLGSDGKMLASRLDVLEKKQLVDVLIGCVADGALTAEQILAKLPSADLQPKIDECRRLVNAVGRHLPNSRFGSATDNYGYKRCASANGAAARAFKTTAAEYKRSGQWAVAAEFCERALPIARDMIEWDDESNNSARNSVLDVLAKLQAEAAAKRPQAAD